ncbi:MAG: hypothetical protein LRZ85_10245 [Alphaproteobacteria bacterium]|nr:hypothetical protein [Alphaproteobacteria bacterium]MCD8525803.1 hypothetical protein [Alphaproteobacteria bacterium]MCD8571423.1 hypothetical protein [Alphaproteobacteria bacterium]
MAALNERSLEENPNARPYVVFWVAPWQKTISEYKAFVTQEAAKRYFSRHKKKPPPVTPTLRRDFQQNLVYLWEEKFIDAHSPNDMTEEQMERIVQRVSDDFNMEAPGIAYKKPNPRHKYAASTYDPTPHAILMKRKKLTWVLHEVGHGVDHKINENQWSDHGPSFVRTIIRLADRYQVWQDPEKLEEEAKKMGILVADDDALPPLPS